MKTKRVNLILVLLVGVILSLLDLCVPHPEGVYTCDPITLAMIVFATVTLPLIQSGLNSLFGRKKPPNNIDRGKVDDIRASVPGYGEFIPQGKGIFRIAPVWIWETLAVDRPVTTTERSGGKLGGGGGGSTTTNTTEHRYFKSVAGVFHDGEIYGGVRRIWFDNNLVARFTNLDARKYEAEHGTLTGGATVSTQAECSGSRKVTGIGSGGKCAISVNTEAADHELAFHYTSSSELTYDIYVDGSLLGSVVCPSSGGATIVAIATYPDPITLIAGDHIIRFENAAAACPALDCIDLAIAKDTSGLDSRAFASAVNVAKIPPPNQDHSWAYLDYVPDPGDGGPGGAPGTPHQSFALGQYGQPSIRIYRGTRTQLADPAIVAQEGADAASAYRGFAYIVIEGVLLVGNRMPNVTLEVDQGVHSVPAIVTDIYGDTGVAAAKLDVSGLAGLHLGSSTIDPGTYANASWQNLTNTTAGSGGAITKTSGTEHTYNAGASHNGTLAAATNGAIRFTPTAGAFSMGFSTSASPIQTSDILFGLQLHHADASSGNRLTLQSVASGANSSVDIGIWAPGDTFQIEIRNNKFRAYQNGIEIGGFTVPVASFPLYPAFIAYSLNAGVTAATVSLAGAIGDAPSAGAGGLLLSSRRSAGDLLADLQTRFQFDMVEVDGVVKAILRNTSTADVTIPYTDMRAVMASPGQLPEIPPFDCEIHDVDSILLPARVDVNYLDPSMDYHNNVQTEMCLSDITRFDNQSVSLSIVDQADNMKKLAITLMHKAEMEGRTLAWQTSYKYMHVHPGSVAALTLPNATHTVRVTQAKYALPAGVIEFQGVRQAPSLYSPTATGSTATGYEPPIAPVPANTKGVFIDAPLVPPENAGDEVQPLLYVAMSGRGSGAWSGSFLYKEHPIASANYQLITMTDKPSGIGVSSGALPAVTDTTVLDTANDLIVQFYSNVALSSATEAELTANLKLNLLSVKNPSTGENEYVQFKTAVAGTAVAPFVSKYTVSDLFRGRFETDGAMVHTAADDVVVMDSAVKVIPMSMEDLNVARNYKFVSSGQAVDDAISVVFTWIGNALRDRKVTNLTAARDGSGNWHVSATGHPRQLPAFYNLRVRRPIDDVIMRDIPISTGVTQSAVFGDTFGEIAVSNNNLSTGAAETFTAVAATDVLTVVGNPFPDGHKVRVSNSGGALPAPLAVATDYFWRDRSGDTGKLAATLGGAAIDLTTDGTGTNSIRTAPFVVSGARTTQELTEPGSFIEFVLPSLDTLAGGSLNLALFESADATWTDTSAWMTGVYTLRMTVVDVVTGEWFIRFWDVGGESAGEELLSGSGVSVGLGAMKIRLTFSGTELRVYKNWANSSTAPLVVSKVPPADHFPMKAAFYLATGAVNNDAARIEQAVIGGMTEPSTIYSKAQQDHDDAVTDMATIDVEMYQVSTVDGRKVREEFP